MKILQFTSLFLPGMGGVQTAVHNLSEGLSALGQDVRVFTPRCSGPLPEHSYDLQRFSVPRGFYRFRLSDAYFRVRLAMALRVWRPDIIHAHNAIPTGYVTARVAGRQGVPYVLTCHGEDIQCYPELDYGYRLDPHKRSKIEFAVRSADHVLGNREGLLQEYIALGADASRLSVSPCGINSEALAAVHRQEARNLLGIPMNVPVVLAVGRNHPVKGFSLLVQSVAELQGLIPDVICLIVGEDTEALNAQIESLDCSGSVRLFPSAAPPGIAMRDRGSRSSKLETYYGAADVFAMPSRIETQGLVTVEAMAAGLPVVGFDVAGTADILTDGVDGVLVPGGDLRAFAQALAGILSDEGERRRMGAAARSRAARFDRSVVAREHLAIYRKLTESSACARADKPEPALRDMGP